MHIPDGFLDAKTWGAMWAVSAAGVGYAAHRSRIAIGDKHVPLMGVTAAFVFAAQMINFPVAGGTSGHFTGACLAAILLGPWSGLLVMSVVLAVQCLVFQDGGLTALGANVCNMGLVGGFAGYFIAAALRKSTALRRASVPEFAGAWAGVVLAASCCAAELAASGTVPIRLALPAMAGVHVLIGVVEGMITVLVLGSIRKLRPDLLELEKA
jgi:cobalt/nickel transport system permease protein